VSDPSTWALLVMESASSKIISLKGGTILPSDLRTTAADADNWAKVFIFVRMTSEMNFVRKDLNAYV
jgi:hypothetical protein